MLASECALVVVYTTNTHFEAAGGQHSTAGVAIRAVLYDYDCLLTVPI